MKNDRQISRKDTKTVPPYFSNLKSQLKAEDKPVPIRLFHRMAKTYNLDKKEKGFWSRHLLKN